MEAEIAHSLITRILLLERPYLQNNHSLPLMFKRQYPIDCTGCTDVQVATLLPDELPRRKVLSALSMPEDWLLR